MTDENAAPPVIPEMIERLATQLHAAVAVTDYYVSRRQRIHILWNATTGEQTEHRSMDELLVQAESDGHRLILQVPGQRTRPTRHRWIHITPLPAPGSHLWKG